jgi:hypothetical protein
MAVLPLLADSMGISAERALHGLMSMWAWCRTEHRRDITSARLGQWFDESPRAAASLIAMGYAALAPRGGVKVIWVGRRADITIPYLAS